MTGQEWLDYFIANDQKKRKNDWLDLAGTGLGAGVGLFLGGPAGAVAGSQIGGAVGNTAENAANKTLSPQGVVSDTMKGVGGYQGMTDAADQKGLMALLQQMGGSPMGFADGGVVPNPDETGFLEWYKQRAQRLGLNPNPDAPEHFYDYRAAFGAGAEPDPSGHWPSQFKREGHPRMVVDGVNTKTGVGVDPFALLEQMLAEQARGLGAGPQTQPFKQASHPGWEALGTIAGDVLSKLPQPRQTNSSNKTIGAYMPALGAAAAGVPKYAAGQRKAANEQIVEQNADARETWTQQARDLANRRWALAMKRAEGGGVKEPDRFRTPIPDALRKQLGVPAGIATYGDLDEWQQSETNKRIAGERQDAANLRATTAADKAADEDAQIEAMALGVVDKSVDPRSVKPIGRQAAMMLRVQNRVNQLLSERGEKRTLRELQQLREEADRFSKAGNSQRFQQLRASAGAAAEHTKQFDEAFKRWNSRAKGVARIAVANMGLFNAAKGGFLGQAAQAEAAALVPVREALINEIPVVLAGGFAPQEQQYHEAQRMMTDMFGQKAQAARVASIRQVLKTRLTMFEKAVPFLGGRTIKDNPYLLDVSPLYGWEEGDKRVIVAPEGGKAGGSAGGGWKPKGAKEVPE